MDKVNHNGKIIVIEGLDGCGKATQTKLLYDFYVKSGKTVQKISFPNYESESSALVKMYLAGKFGEKPGDVNAYAASSFYAVDRYASYKNEWESVYKAKGIIIADRYTTSNAIHQCSKLPETQWDKFLEWLFVFEYKQLGIPAPDEVIYLQGNVDISQRLMSNRYYGDESKKDIHESDVDYMFQAQKAAEYCAEKLQWNVVQCIKNNEMREINDIHNEIIQIITQD